MNKIINLLVIIACLDCLTYGIECKFQSISQLSKENQSQDSFQIIEQLEDVHEKELFIEQLTKLSGHTNLIPDIESYKIISKTLQGFVINNVIAKDIMDKFYRSLLVIIDVITHINTIDKDSTIKNDLIKSIINSLNIQNDKLLFLQIITKEIKDLSIIQLFVNNLFFKQIIVLKNNCMFKILHTIRNINNIDKNNNLYRPIKNEIIKAIMFPLDIQCDTLSFLFWLSCCYNLDFIKIILKKLRVIQCDIGWLIDVETERKKLQYDHDDNHISISMNKLATKRLEQYNIVRIFLIDLFKNINKIDTDMVIKQKIIKKIITALDIEGDKLLLLKTFTNEIEDLTIIHNFVEQLGTINYNKKNYDNNNFLLDIINNIHAKQGDPIRKEALINKIKMKLHTEE